MKNVMVIDGADNCAYDIFAVEDEEFRILFPAKGQDIAFIDELSDTVPPASLDAILRAMWGRRVEKQTVEGLHGILFYELEFKKQYYPNRRDSDLTAGLGRAAR